MLSLTIKWFISEIWANSWLDTHTPSVPLTWGWDKQENKERGALTTLQITENPFHDPWDLLVLMKIGISPPVLLLFTMFSSATRWVFLMFWRFRRKTTSIRHIFFLGVSSNGWWEIRIIRGICVDGMKRPTTFCRWVFDNDNLVEVLLVLMFITKPHWVPFLRPFFHLRFPFLLFFFSMIVGYG